MLKKNSYDHLSLILGPDFQLTGVVPNWADVYLLAAVI